MHRRHTEEKWMTLTRMVEATGRPEGRAKKLGLC